MTGPHDDRIAITDDLYADFLGDIRSGDYDHLAAAARETGPWVYDPETGKLVPKAAQPQPNRSHLAGPMIVSDGIEVVNQLDGRTYTSKSALRATYRAAGVEEVGNTPPAPKRIDRLPAVRDDLKAALTQHGVL